MKTEPPPKPDPRAKRLAEALKRNIARRKVAQAAKPPPEQEKK
jgi:hypothetical protein